MPAPACERELTLWDLAARLDMLARQIELLSEKLEVRAGELVGRLGALERAKEPVRPPFPTTAEKWEQFLTELFGTLLTPPLVQVCARLLLGMRAKEIALELGRPLTTVKSQIAAIRDRFRLSRSEAVPLHVFQRFWDAYVRTGPWM